MLSCKKIVLVGYFAFGTDDNGGQAVKTRELYYALSEKYGGDNVNCVESMGWKKSPFRLIKVFFSKAKKSDCLIMLPAHNGVKVFSRLLLIAKKLWNKKVYYDVIGGWLPEMLESDRELCKVLKRFDGIWVETNSMKTDMEKLGFCNISVVPNFKSLERTPILEYDEFLKIHSENVRFCTFSRVLKEKGIEDAISAVKAANLHFGGKPRISLDIYGQIDDNYSLRFEELKKAFPEFIEYKGIAAPDECVDVLKNYYALLFPTHYYTEGIPGTLVDALFAGVPVILAKWKNCDDIYDEGITGWGYAFGENSELEGLIVKAVKQKELFFKMKNTALDYSQRFSADTAVIKIANLLN